MMTTSSLQYIFFLITVAFIQRPVVGRYIIAPLSHNCNHTFFGCEVQKRQRKNGEKQVHLSVPAPIPPSNLFFLSANVSLPTPASPPQNRSRITMRYNQQVLIYSPVEQLVLCLFSLLAPSTIPRKLSPPASIKGIFIIQNNIPYFSISEWLEYYQNITDKYFITSWCCSKFGRCNLL